MQTKPKSNASGAPERDVGPTPVRDDAADRAADRTGTQSQPDAEREARRTTRSARREASTERPGVMIPNRLKRLPLETPLMRTVATAGIVGIAVVIAAIMASQDAAGWLTGLVVSSVSLVLAAMLWSSRRL